MANRRRLITCTVLAVATIAIVIAVAIAGIFFLRGSNNTVAMPGPTAVGIPNGPATTKSIGPAGGSIATPDGRIVVDVPPNALSRPTDFSIQPISNLAHGGLGNAYRLDPGGYNFATPVKVSFKVDDQDLKASPAVAYQDAARVWQAFTTSDIDQASKTIAISIPHFTDVSVVTYRLSPEKATLRVRETQYIELVGCRGEGNLLNRLRKLFGRGDQQICYSSSASKPSWSANLGTIVPAGTGALYTAPAKKPSPNVDKVYLTYEYVSDDSGKRSIGVFESEITIVDRGYKATGRTGDVVYSGVVCNLEKRFVVTGTSSLNSYPFTFVPTSPTSGTVSFDAMAPGIKMEGSGSYKIVGADTDKPRIAMTMGSAGHTQIGSRSGGGTVYIDLIPFDTDECNK